MKTLINIIIPAALVVLTACHHSHHHRRDNHSAFNSTLENVQVIAKDLA